MLRNENVEKLSFHHALRVIWDIECDGGIHFYLTRQNGQSHVKIVPHLKSFLTKRCLSYPVLFPDSKNVIFFRVRRLELPKIAFQKLPKTSKNTNKTKAKAHFYQ